MENPPFARNLDEYIKIVKKYDAKAFCFSNGYRMFGRYMQRCVDAGLDFYRFSMIGYDANKYNEMMHSIGGNFDMICENIMQMQDYVEKSGSDCVVATYHLITDTDNQEEELEKYKELVKRLGVKSEIWRMHNWSGVYDNKDKRNGTVKTCGAHLELMSLFVQVVWMDREVQSHRVVKFLAETRRQF